MAMTNLAKGYENDRRPLLGPPLSFFAALLATAAAAAIAAKSLHWDAVLPLASSALWFFAAVVAVFGWRPRGSRQPAALSYWDVAGALTLIGIGCSALIDPDQMVRLVAGPR